VGQKKVSLLIFAMLAVDNVITIIKRPTFFWPTLYIEIRDGALLAIAGAGCVTSINSVTKYNMRRETNQ